MSDLMNYTVTKREIDGYDYDESLIEAGDFISITRLDGIDPLIMYGTGSVAGHTAVIIKFDG